MKKADRQKIFEKYGGRCAYCGCELGKGWHVDEIEPIRRKEKFILGHWEKDQWVPSKVIPDGCLHPERIHVDNQNPACASCNINKHSASLEEFRQMIAKFINSLNQYSTQYKIAKRYGLLQETERPVVFYFETLNP